MLGLAALTGAKPIFYFPAVLVGGAVPAMYFRQSMICASVMPLARSHSASRANSFAVVRPLKIGIKTGPPLFVRCEKRRALFPVFGLFQNPCKDSIFDLVPKEILSAWQTGCYRSASPN